MQKNSTLFLKHPIQLVRSFELAKDPNQHLPAQLIYIKSLINLNVLRPFCGGSKFPLTKKPLFIFWEWRPSSSAEFLVRETLTALPINPLTFELLRSSTSWSPRKIPHRGNWGVFFFFFKGRYVLGNPKPGGIFWNYMHIAAKFGFCWRELDGFKLIYQNISVKVVQNIVSANENQNVYYNIETAWLSCALISA